MTLDKIQSAAACTSNQLTLLRRLADLLKLIEVIEKFPHSKLIIEASRETNHAGRVDVRAEIYSVDAKEILPLLQKEQAAIVRTIGPIGGKQS